MPLWSSVSANARPPWRRIRHQPAGRSHLAVGDGVRGEPGERPRRSATEASRRNVTGYGSMPRSRRRFELREPMRPLGLDEVSRGVVAHAGTAAGAGLRPSSGR